MIIYVTETTNPFLNLATEEFLFSCCGTLFPKNETLFMLWQNSPTVVCGSYQNISEEINLEYAEKNKIHIVRRITGGGAVFHDLGNVNFSIIKGCSDEKEINFGEFSRLILNALKALGINGECSGRNDLMINGRKFSGCAQTVKDGVVLHHGTLMYNVNMEALKNVLVVNREKLSSKGAQSVDSRVINIADILKQNGVPAETRAFMSLLYAEIKKQNVCKELILSDEDKARINKLQKDRYENPDWTWGRSPGYSVNKYIYCDAGLIKASMNIGKGDVIKDISFTGDFFGIKPIEVLENALKGCCLERCSIISAMERLSSEGNIVPGDYIYKASPENLVSLLCR